MSGTFLMVRLAYRETMKARRAARKDHSKKEAGKDRKGHQDYYRSFTTSYVTIRYHVLTSIE